MATTNNNAVNDNANRSSGDRPIERPEAVNNQVADLLNDKQAIKQAGLGTDQSGQPLVTDNKGVQRLDFKPQDGMVASYMGQSPEQISRIAANGNGRGLESGEAKVANGGDGPTTKIDRSSEKGDRVKEAGEKPETTPEKAKEHFARVLEQTGMRPAEAEALARKTYDRLGEVKDGGGADKAESRLKGTPAEQLERMAKGFENILNPKENFSGLDQQARQNMVKDLAHRIMSPSDFVNQGGKNTCALQALQKQHMEAGDPAKTVEMAESVVNKGYADVPGTNQDGSPMRVHVMRESLQPDKESGQAFSTSKHGTDGGLRGMGGQVLDALYGQAHADNYSIRRGLPTSADGFDKAGSIYVTAGANNPPFNIDGSRSNTGEAFLVRDKGEIKFLSSSPAITTYDREWLNQTFGGKPGSVLVHESADRGPQFAVDPDKPYPAHLNLKPNTYKTNDELREKVAQIQNETGHSAQLLVHSDHLTGNSVMKGRVLHALTATMTDKGLVLDNQNGKNFDRILDDRRLTIATDANNWDFGGSRVVAGKGVLPHGDGQPGGQPGDKPRTQPRDSDAGNAERGAPASGGGDAGRPPNKPETDPNKDPLKDPLKDLTKEAQAREKEERDKYNRRKGRLAADGSFEPDHYVPDLDEYNKKSK
ncbi:MAG: hypothetical protein K2Y32_23165 [Candidatus Obscuribacterales bacterium]|nr:hypothetical protein [Candidatus Obscuribacterales bacterium]